jgi:GNAT superfamily N-acetyltransferase
MGIHVRRAEQDDAGWILSQLRAFAAFYGSKRSLFGPDEHVQQVLSNLIDSHLVLIAEQDGPIGVIGGVFQGHPFNPEIKCCTELFFWVSQDSRGSRAGSALLKAFDAMASASADWITLSLIEGRSPISDRSYTRMGYRPSERSYLKEVG